MFCKFFQIWRNYPINDAKIASVNMLNFIKQLRNVQRLKMYMQIRTNVQSNCSFN